MRHVAVVVLALLGACGDGKSSARVAAGATQPAAKVRADLPAAPATAPEVAPLAPPCDDVIDHVVMLAAESDARNLPEKRRAEAKAAVKYFKASALSRCLLWPWTPAQRSCVTAAKTVDEAEACDLLSSAPPVLITSVRATDSSSLDRKWALFLKFKATRSHAPLADHLSVRIKAACKVGRETIVDESRVIGLRVIDLGRDETRIADARAYVEYGLEPVPESCDVSFDLVPLIEGATVPLARYCLKAKELLEGACVE